MYPRHPLLPPAEPSSTSEPEDTRHQRKSPRLLAKHHRDAQTHYPNTGAASTLSFLFPGDGNIPQKPGPSDRGGLGERLIATVSVDVDPGGADENTRRPLRPNGGFDQPPSPLDTAIQNFSPLGRSPEADDRLAGKMDDGVEPIQVHFRPEGADFRGTGNRSLQVAGERYYGVLLLACLTDDFSTDKT